MSHTESPATQADLKLTDHWLLLGLKAGANRPGLAKVTSFLLAFTSNSRHQAGTLFLLLQKPGER